MAFLQGLIAALFAITPVISGQTFTLQQNYTGIDFFNNGFQVYNGYDPTFGYVHYVDLPTAEQHDLIDIANVTATGIAQWGVDTDSVLDPTANLGRMSLRLQSTATYTHGLFILDVAHVPASTCGSWPAFWLVGSNTWPDAGEIDIIETTNNVGGNLMSLHSTATPNCTIAGTAQSGTLLTNDCAYANSYTGCAVSVSAATTSGSYLNSVGGGIYAMLWNSNGIQMWTFPRNGLPPSLVDSSNTPDPAEFGVPTANFQGSCDFDAHFYDQQIIFDIDFCGSNAGETFEIDGCPMTSGNQSWESCNIYVANNPQAYLESYWEVNSLRVYQNVAGPPAGPPPPSSSSTPVASTSSVSTLSNAANGASTTPTSPIAGPTTTAVQARDLTSFAGATWPVSFTTPEPYSLATNLETFPTILTTPNKIEARDNKDSSTWTCDPQATDCPGSTFTSIIIVPDVTTFPTLRTWAPASHESLATPSWTAVATAVTPNGGANPVVTITSQEIQATQTAHSGGGTVKHQGPKGGWKGSVVALVALVALLVI